ncbi:NAD(P)/FAD-dependent oxidoreductase [Oxalicibacterium faecigallinarum]|uniref:Dehydrogenase n=1 Tax=Oxalicibacterium faecigallinarum TaxID=573741 RepID=A0A8J3F256_9BURK|nr:FAD-dependent oxidoreductase [Oxalicibacterium faecigallinarum]GGI20592.1 dehydrogenase [Oxalicibacterium faecigallinarum]
MNRPQRIAVIGSGIAGLAAAWLLAREHEVTLYEANDYFGGHTHTVDVTLEGITAPVDTGFLVHNDLTYPNLIALFRHLGVQTHETSMSFSVGIKKHGIEWAGNNLDTVFCQRRNLFNPRFLGMLKDILRFNRNASAYLIEADENGCTLGHLLDRHAYGSAMREWYLLPMTAAIWSCSTQASLDFPAATFLRFCLNHCLLQINERPIWKTVREGARDYVNRMLPAIDQTHLRCPVRAVRRTPQGVVVQSVKGVEQYDQVVMACHAPVSLKLLDCNEEEARILGAFRTEPNHAVLHTDSLQLPARRKAWAAWNYRLAAQQSAAVPVTVSYLINALQPVPWQQPVIVTLNPYEAIAEHAVLAQFDYAHPIMDAAAIAAQCELPRIQGKDRVWFCGAWQGYGFHEDGLKSALRVARDFGIAPPWEAVYE